MAIEVSLIKNGCGQIPVSVSPSWIQFVRTLVLIHLLAAIKLQKVPVDHKEDVVAFDVNETGDKAERRGARISLPLKAYEGKGTISFLQYDSRLC